MENAHEELSLNFDCARSEMAWIEAQFEEANNELKEHNKLFLQLSHVTKTLRLKLASFEPQAAEL